MPLLRLGPTILCLALLSLMVSIGQATDAEDTAAADERVLQERGVGTDGPALLAFLRGRSLSEEDRAQMVQLVRQLGDNDFEKRQAASQQFIARGPIAVPFLKAALNDADAEIARRAQLCLEEINSGSGPTLPLAVIHQVMRKQPPGAVEMLLRFVPFADDDTVEEACLEALRILAVRGGEAVPAVIAALRDKEPRRRGAAAYVVAVAKNKEQRQQAEQLLRDPAPLLVRLRTAQGLLAVRDPQAVPVLIDLLREGPPEVLSRAEDLLLRLAGEKGPATTLTTAEERKKAQAAWLAWWKENERSVDLAKIDETAPFLNLTLVCEMHGGKIWEIGADGKVRWTMTNLNCPRDAQILPGGRILITEVNDNKIREREIATSKILWEHDIKDPSFVRRLPNGNTFVATHDFCYEITPDSKKVFNYQPEQGFLIHSIDRRTNGNVVCLSMSGIVREINRDGKTVREFNVSNQGGGNWCGVQALSGNRYLCVEFGQGEVFEFDAAGKVQWKCKVAGASYALRLPNGLTMICSFGGMRVVHVDREGKVVWETKVATQPWRARVR